MGLSKRTALHCIGVALLAGLPALLSAQALTAAQVSALKQKLVQRLPEVPAIEEVRPTPVPGLLEIKAGQHVFYTDAKGDFVIDGSLIDTRSQRNLTQERLDDINRIDFASLPLKDAVVWKNGSGKRKLVIFSDPNCGYCKRLEKDIQQIKDVTVYTFLIPILGDDSQVKSNNIWCVKDRTQVYRDWMLEGTVPPKAFGMCATPMKRNLELAQKYRINGTPAMVFEDGTRLASAAPAETIEQRLVKASGK